MKRSTETKVLTENENNVERETRSMRRIIRNQISGNKINRDLIENYFRYRISTLFNALSLSEKYYKRLVLSKNEPSDNKTKSPIKKLKPLAMNFSILLIKHASTKSKYRLPEKFNKEKSLILESIDYSFNNKNVVQYKEQFNELKNDLKSLSIKKPPSSQSQRAINEFEYAIWKKRKGYPERVKLFIIIGGYDGIRSSLIKRGWLEIKDKSSPYFDLKWTTKSKDIDSKTQQDFQITNHFKNIFNLTSKIGLCRNLRNLISIHNIDVDDFYPRCYDLADKTEFEDFVEDYKYSQALCILKKFINDFAGKKLYKENVETVNVCYKICTERYSSIEIIMSNIKVESFLSRIIS